MFLLVAMLRVAHFFLFPATYYTESNVSKVQNTVKSSYHALESMIIFVARSQMRLHQTIESAFAFLFQLFDELIFSLIPFTATYICLFLWGRTWRFVLTWIYWIKYAFIYFSFGERTIWEIFRDPTRKQHHEKHEWDNLHERRKRVEWIRHRRDALEEFHISYRNFWETSMTKTNKRITRIWDEAQERFGNFTLLRNRSFEVYALFLFSCAFFFYLGRIFAFNLGFIRPVLPRMKPDVGAIWRRSSGKRCRRRNTCRNRHRKHASRKRRKWKRKWHSFLDVNAPTPSTTRPPTNMRPSPGPTVYAAVCNVDDISARVGRGGYFSFDSDSGSVVCDNSANVHICNDRNMFVGEISSLNDMKVATIGGHGHQASGMGTVKWKWFYDNGATHEFLIEDVLFFPESPINILSVTSFARQLDDKTGTGIMTLQSESILFWQDRKFSRTLHHPPSNLPEMSINEGFSLSRTYRAMVSKVVNTKVNPLFSCHFTHLDCEEGCACGHSHAHGTFKDLKTEVFEVGETLIYSKNGYTSFVKVKAIELDDNNVLQLRVVQQNNEELLTTKEFLRSPGNPDIGWIPTSVPEYASAANNLTDAEIEQIRSPAHLSPLQQEFLSLHNRLFHLPFMVMLRMAKFWILPCRFLKLRNDLPPCTSCLFGQSHRRPWKHKSSTSATGGVLRGPNATDPGQTIGTDQIVSAQPGLVPQEKGQLTRARVWGATVFVDYATKWIKVHLMTSLSGNETLEAKESFEHACASRGVEPKHFHADNGRFAEDTFTKDCKSKLQKLTFCGVGAHHQNGVAENTIKQLTLTARTLLLHAQRYWPEYISTMLWTFALLSAADRLNNLHVDLDGKTPEIKFSQAAGNTTRLKNFHTFGCPVYVLDARLQDSGGPGVPKWEPRARLGVYVGHSPYHAGSVALVLNPKTGLVSPQFHVVFDDDFSTVPHLRAGTVPDNWAQLVQNSREKSVDGFYDVTKTWYEGSFDPTSGDTITSPSEGEVLNFSAPDPLQASAEGNDDSAQTKAKIPVEASAPDSRSQAKISAEAPAPDSRSQVKISAEAPAPDSSFPILAKDLKEALASDPCLAATDSAQASAKEEDLGGSRSTTDSAKASASEEDNSAKYTTFDQHSKMPPIIDLSSSGLRHSARKKKQPIRFGFAAIFTSICTFGFAFASASNWSPALSNFHSAAENTAFTTINKYHAANCCIDGTLNCLHPMVFLAGKENNETYTFREMLQQTDSPTLSKQCSKR